MEECMEVIVEPSDEVQESVKYLTASDLLKAPRKIVEKKIESLGGVVRIKEFRGKDQDQFEKDAAQAKKRGDDFRGFRAKTIVASLIDESGRPLFQSKQQLELQEMPFSILDTIFTEILELNGMDKDAEDRIKEDFGEDPRD